MTASVSYWNTLKQSATLLLRYTILPSHFALSHLGFKSAIVWSSHKGLDWSRDSQRNGECVSIQFYWIKL